MHRAAAVLLVAATAAAAPTRPARKYTIEELMKTVSIVGGSFSADEKGIVFSSDESGVFNVYSVPVAGGKARALTRSKETTLAVGAFPKDERVLFTRDQGGNENNHLYVLEKGKERDLTPGKLKASFAGFSHDDAAFYVLTNERDPKFFDVYRFDATSYARTLLYKDETGYQLRAVSDDEKWLAFDKPITTSDSSIYLYSVEKRTLELITPHTAPAEYAAEKFDRSSRYLYYRTDEGGEFKRLRRYELATGKSEDVAKRDWDIASFDLSWTGKYRLLVVNADGHSKVEIADAATGTPLDLPPLPDGEIRDAEFSRSEGQLALSISSDRRPLDLYVVDLGARKLTRLTDNLNKRIDPEDLVDSQVVRFKSFDGLEIPNIFYQPQQASPEHRAPAIVWVHGGPGGQTRAGYSPLIQYLVNHGYVILGINNRGSSGYGKSFYTADDRKHGHEPLDDCVAAKKYLAGLPAVDPARIGILGGSYGGYMVLAALAFRPDEFVVGVDLFGVANWLRILKSIPPYWESFRQALYAEIGDPDKDAEMLKEISPLFHAEQIVKPLLVLQGKNDPRVLKVESDEMVAAVRKNGVPVEYVVFDDEGHGFAKKKNEIVGYRKILEFLDKHLR